MMPKTIIRTNVLLTLVLSVAGCGASAEDSAQKKVDDELKKERAAQAARDEERAKSDAERKAELDRLIEQKKIEDKKKLDEGDKAK
jgi:Ni/Co efflux regulator RcnB